MSNQKLTSAQMDEIRRQASFELGCAAGLVKFASLIEDQAMQQFLHSHLSPAHRELLSSFQKAGAQGINQGS